MSESIKLNLIQMHQIKSFVLKYRYIIIFWLLTRFILFSIRLDTDHSIFYYIADSIRNGGTLYIDAWDHKPPSIFLLAIPFTYLGPNYYLHRVIYSLINILATIGFFKFVIRFLKTETAFTDKIIYNSAYLGTVLFTLMSLLAGIDGNNNEIWGISIFILILQISKVKDVEMKWPKFVLKYLLYSVLITLKPNFGIFLLFEIPQIFTKKNFFKLNLIRGLLIASLPVIYILYFLSIGKLFELWNASILFSAGYSAMHNKFFDLGELKNIVVVSGLVGTFSLILYKLRSEFKYKRTIYILLAMTSIYFMYYMLSGTHYEYYILVLTPFLALIFGVMMARWKKVGIFFLLALTMYVIGIYVTTVLINNNKSDWYPVSDKDVFTVAEYIKANKSEKDTCVFFTPTPTISIFSECPSPSRFLNMTNYMHDMEGGMNNGYLEEFVKSIQAKKPRYLVVSKLFEYYKYDSRIKGIYDSTEFAFREGGLEVRKFNY
jgi:hypothetical protein